MPKIVRPTEDDLNALGFVVKQWDAVDYLRANARALRRLLTAYAHDQGSVTSPPKKEKE